IKPNFLWMMFRSGWATKPDQERILAVRIARPFFEELLTKAVPSTYARELFETRELWSKAVARSEVRLPWDPDHNPAGVPGEGRAVELGLRGNALATYGESAIIALEDVTDLVERERAHSRPPYTDLTIPRERVFTPSAAGAQRLGLTIWKSPAV